MSRVLFHLPRIEYFSWRIPDGLVSIVSQTNLCPFSLYSALNDRGASLLDDLLSSDCIVFLQYEGLRLFLVNQTRSLENVARELFSVMRSRHGSKPYNSFCAVLRTLRGGGDLYTRISSLSHDSNRGSDESVPLNEETSDHPSENFTTMLKIAYVIVDVHTDLRNVWEPNRESATHIIKTCTRSALPGRDIKIEPAYVSSMTTVTGKESTSRSSCFRLAARFRIPIDRDKCLLRISLPKTTEEIFRKCRDDLLGRMSNLFKIEIRKIDIFQGSCFVHLTLTGKGFINFICGLHAPNNFVHLITFDSHAQIQIGSLPPVELSVLLRNGQPQPVCKALSVLQEVQRATD